MNLKTVLKEIGADSGILGFTRHPRRKRKYGALGT